MDKETSRPHILKPEAIYISKNDVEFAEYEEVDFNSECKLGTETYPVDESELRSWSITGEGFIGYNKPKYNHKRETDSYRLMMKKRKAKNRKKRRMK